MQPRPVEVVGAVIARSFWGRAWLRNVTLDSELASRVPRARASVRRGELRDLRFEAGRIEARVRSRVLTIQVPELTAAQIKALEERCAGRIDSVETLLSGAIPEQVVDLLSRPGEGLLPGKGWRAECACGVRRCGHVATAWVGGAARLDEEPKALFSLRGITPDRLVALPARAPSDGPLTVRLVNALAESDGATAAELAHQLAASRSDVVVELVELESLGVAVCRGTGVSTRWRLG